MIFMELCLGTLEEFIGRRSFAMVELACLVRQIAEGLHFMHDNR